MSSLDGGDDGNTTGAAAQHAASSSDTASALATADTATQPGIVQRDTHARGEEPLPMVEMWSDGACKGNPGPGGWGVWMRSGGHEKELFGGETDTTNNRMELTAVIEGLKALNTRCQVRLYVDSSYVMQGMTSWLPGWKRNGWRTAAKKPVKNEDLWRALDEQVSRHEVHWQWVKGHAGNAGNERADDLANQGVDSLGE